ncbi:MAG: M24 family metallopeptidase, partial [Actinomycetota bacterium]
MDYLGRLDRLRSRLEAEELDGLYVTNLTNIRYLCGFTGSSGSLLVTADGVRFFTDSRYRLQSAEEVEGAEVAIYRLEEELVPLLRAAAADLAASRIGFEATQVTVSALERQRSVLEGRDLIATSGWVEDLRRIKDPEELARIRVAAEMADEALSFILERVAVGRSERELALELELHMREAGAEGVSFSPIVAVGERSAMPHAHPTEHAVEKGAYLLFDLGCIYRGYCSDLTRTVVIGPPAQRHQEIYELVAAAQRQGIQALAPGRAAAQVDRAAREVIAAGGHAEAFGHGLGHGVGMEIHEAPKLGITSEDVLASGCVVTVEPGVYLQGFGGV